MIRKSWFPVAALCIIVSAAFLNGCGSGNKEGTTAVFTRVSEAACAQCHGSAVSAVTAQPIYGGWQQSSHFLKPVNPNDPNAGADQTVAADCQRCHGGGSAHNGVGPIQYPQPDVAGICNQCHNADTFAATAPQHVTSVTFTDINGNSVASATYMNSVSKCTNCHDPHDSTLTARFGTTALSGVDPDTGLVGLYGDWADSGHADTQAAPWTDEDFGAPGQAACARCHTASGYKLYLQNPQAGGWAWKTGAAANDTSKEVLRCDACHTNYAFTRRNGATNGSDAALVPYSVPSGALSGNLLSNAGDSNLCINCHTGRSSGTAITTKFANLSSNAPNSHYMAAAGVLYNIIGFESYSSAYTHARYTAVGFRHDQIGLDSGFNLGTSRGPCVGCHYTDPSTGNFFAHALDAFVGTTGLTGVVTQASKACGNCHFDGTPLQLQATDLNTLKAQYKAGLDAIATLLRARYGIYYTSAKYPYFFADAAFTHSKIRWDVKARNGGDGRSLDYAGRRLAGTAFNLNLLTREPGGYAHNQQYSMTMIYDAIDYLEDGKMDGILYGTNDVPLTTLQYIFSATVDGVNPVNARPIP